MRIATGFLLVSVGLIGLGLSAGQPRRRDPAPQTLAAPPKAAVNSPAAPIRLRPGSSADTANTAAPEAVEDLFICPLYSVDPDAGTKFEQLLFSLGARRSKGRLVYNHPRLDRTVVVHMVNDRPGLERALTTEGAHVVICSHANYGLGPSFATPMELWSQTITNLRSIDDERIFAYSTPWVGVNIYKLREEQRYPFWEPVYRDGSSGVMPYTFGDPAGDPPYNFLLTYQLPGDPTHYPIEDAPGSFLERFPTSHRSAWYAADGGAPDPANPAHRDCYITNEQSDFRCNGSWSTAYFDDEASDDYCLIAKAGKDGSTATWFFDIPRDGLYDVAAWWPARTQHADGVPYTVNHDDGSTTVRVNQRRDGMVWMPLGRFAFTAGTGTVTVSNDAIRGLVIADAIRVTAADAPEAFDEVIDNDLIPLTHYGSRTIVARKAPALEPDRLRYARLYMDSCYSGLYFMGTLHRGITFFTLDDSHSAGVLPYLRAYLQGASDAEIWAAMQAADPIHDYYDFTQPPPSMRKGAPDAPRADKAMASIPATRLTAADLDPARQRRLRGLAACPTTLLPRRLRSPEYLASAALLRLAARTGYERRPSEGLAMAIGVLTDLAASPLAADARTRTTQSERWAVARAVLTAFPEAAVPRLIELYDGGDAVTQGLVLQAMGPIDDDGAVDAVLLAALEDRRPCDRGAGESLGEPLRLCDVAYNQIVLRHGLRGVQRVLGSSHRIAVRDDQIATLLRVIDRL